NIYDNATGQLLGTVSNSGVGWTVTPNGPLQALAQQFDKTPDQVARELNLVISVFNTQQVGNAIINQTQPKADPNSKGQGGSSSPPPDQQKNGNTGPDQTKITNGAAPKLPGGDNKTDSQNSTGPINV